jgi:hypothetical protein
LGKLLSKARGVKAEPVKPPVIVEQPKHFHTGPIHSTVAGRTDHLPVHVPSDSYVLPADIVSALGEGNTINGFKRIRRMFAGTPYGEGETPYGQGKAHGGEVSGVPVVVAGGEYVLKPIEVKFAGDGDIKRGHRVLDDFVKEYRAKTVKTLQKLPGPKKN